MEDAPQTGALIQSGKLQKFVRRECREMIGELLSNQNEDAQLKAVMIPVLSVVKKKCRNKRYFFRKSVVNRRLLNLRLILSEYRDQIFLNKNQNRIRLVLVVGC